MKRLLILAALFFLSGAFATVPRDVDIKTLPTDMLITHAAGDYLSPPDPAAQAELARRPNLAEELIAELERVAATDSPSIRHQLYIGTLTQYTSPSLEQRTRVLTMVKQAYQREKKVTAESGLSQMDRLLFQQAPLAFVAYENPEAEAMFALAAVLVVLLRCTKGRRARA